MPETLKTKKKHENVPLWLDIKTEYIDENFEKVLEFLKNGNRDDSFYRFTLDILAKRGIDLIETMKSRPLYYGEPGVFNKTELIFEARLLAALLLTDGDTNRAIKKRLLLSMLNSIAILVPPDLCSDLLMIMVNNLVSEADPKIMFNWDDIIRFEPEVFSQKIIKSMIFEDSKSSELSYENKGTLFIGNDALSIVPFNEDILRIKRFQLVNSITLLDGKINLATSKNDKLKKSVENNFEALEKFTSEFITDQQNVSSSRVKVKKTYNEGDTLNAKVVSIYYNSIKIRSTNPEYETIEGKIVINEPNILYYNYMDFSKYLKPNDDIEVELESYAKRTFIIKNSFVKYLMEDIIIGGDQIGKTALARVMNIATNKRGEKQIDWFTEDGYTVHTSYDDRFSRDEFGKLKILNLGTGNYYGYVNAAIIGPSNEYFNMEQIKKDLIEGFVFEPSWDEDAKTTMLNEGSIRDLIRMLLHYQKTIVNPSERFKVLCVLKTMACLINSEEYVLYIGFIIEYLKQLILFAKGNYDKIRELEPASNFNEVDVVRLKCDIVRILKAYGNENDNETLDKLIKESTDDTMIKIAKLVQSCNTLGDIVPAATKNIIKLEITKSLSLETEDATDLDEENGIYLGIEDRHQEFKTSFVYPPNYNMMPNYHLQKKNIFKVLCGFLNTQAGGTLYIGVSDLGYVVGFEADMVYLKLDTIDSYMRFIQDEAKKSFSQDELALFQMKPMYDDKVLSIKVEPYENGIVELDGTAYIRINNETLVMTEKMMKQIRAKKLTPKQRTELKVN